METKPIETYTVSPLKSPHRLGIANQILILFLHRQVHEYLRSKLCSLYENDCIFDKFECCWNGNDTAIMTGSYNNFFRMFDRNSRKEVTYEASRDIARPKTLLKPRKVRKAHESNLSYLSFVVQGLDTIIFSFLIGFPRLAGEYRREAQEGRDLRRLPRLQQEDLAHRLAPARKYHRCRSHK